MLMDPRVAGLVVGYGADLALGDPRRGHPVAAFGHLAGRLGRAWWSDVRSLAREGDAMSRLLRSGDLEAGRARLSHVCAREARTLDLEVPARVSADRAVRLSARVGLGSVLVATGLAQLLSRSGRGGARG